MADDPPAPRIPASGATDGSPADDAAHAEEAALGAGLSAEELAAQAAGTNVDASQDPVIDGLPQIPRGPAVREQVRAAASGSDSQARAEAKQIGSGRSVEELAQDAAEQEHGRTQRFREAVERVAILGIYAGALGILILAGTWLINIVLPLDERWLEPEDLAHIQTILTAGVLVGAVGGHFKRRMGDPPKE